MSDFVWAGSPLMKVGLSILISTLSGVAQAGLNCELLFQKNVAPLGVIWTPYALKSSAAMPAVLADPYVQFALSHDPFRKWLLEKVGRGEGHVTDFKQLIDAVPLFPEGTLPLPPRKGRKLAKPEELRPDELEAYILANYRLADDSSVRRAHFTDEERVAHHPLLSKATDEPRLAQALEKIHTTWEDLLREAPEKDRSSLLPVPNKFVVAGGRFRESYYWDTLWIMKGLIESGYGHTARGMLENLVSLYEEHGIIPNGNRFYYLTRTQLPVFMEMVTLLERNGELNFSAAHLGPLEKRTLNVAQDYYRKIWKGTTRYNPEFGLFKYSDGAGGAENSKLIVIRPEAGLLEPRSKELHSQRVFAESGWDMSYSRFGHSPQNFFPVDLNFTLLGYTRQLSQVLARSGRHDDAAFFANESRQIGRRLQQTLFDPSTGLYVDYDFVHRARSKVVTAASFFGFYFRGYSQSEEARRILKRLYVNLKPAGDLGLHTTNRSGEGQWDGSWSWAPLNEIAFQSLKAYGLSNETRSLAFDYCLMTIGAYYKYGSFYEKYQARDGSIHLPAQTEIYGNEEGFGWTNGVTSVFLTELANIGELPRLERALESSLLRKSR